MLDDILQPKETKNKASSTSALSLILVVSIVSGLISGVIGGIAGSRYAKQLFPQSIPTGSLSDKNTNAPFVPVTTDEQATVNVVRLASDSVVSIIIKKDLDRFYQSTGRFPFDEFFGFGFPFEFQQPGDKGRPKGKQQVGGGSGFVISSDGMILTNKHVVSDPDAEYTVITADGAEHQVKVLATDPVNDLAIMKIDAKDLSTLVLGDSSAIQIGQTVIAIGNTLGEYRNTVTRGVISGINRVVQASNGSGSTEVIQEAIQTDAAINPGNSGGPLLDLSGTVIGINTAVNQEGQSIGFAIPINAAKRSVESVKKHGKIIRPWLGVRYAPVDIQVKEANKLNVSYGALIVGNSVKKEPAVIPGSPADKAGIKEGDIIMEINGVKINAARSLANEIAKYAPGDEVKLKISTKDKEREVKVKLEEFQQ